MSVSAPRKCGWRTWFTTAGSAEPRTPPFGAAWITCCGVGPLGDLPGASRLVRVQFLDPVYREDAITVGVRWETVGVTGGLFPVLDADIKLSAEGSQGTRVALTGCYRPPFGALGARLDRMLMHTVASLT
jgi:hypothetical protein